MENNQSLKRNKVLILESSLMFTLQFLFVALQLIDG